MPLVSIKARVWGFITQPRYRWSMIAKPVVRFRNLPRRDRSGAVALPDPRSGPGSRKSDARQYAGHQGRVKKSSKKRSMSFSIIRRRMPARYRQAFDVAFFFGRKKGCQLRRQRKFSSTCQEAHARRRKPSASHREALSIPADGGVDGQQEIPCDQRRH